jgi:hypothetical protein
MLMGGVSEMTKHTEDNESVNNSYEQSMSSELLMRSHTLTEAIIDQLRKKNDDTGLELEVNDLWAKSNQQSMATRRVKAKDVFIEYESVTKEQKLKWLAQVQNQRTGKFYSIASLIRDEIIDESERQLFNLPPGIDDYPYREIYQFHRIKAKDGHEYFSTHEQWVGITKNAAVVEKSISDIHWYIKPSVSYELRNTDGSTLQSELRNIDSKTVRIAITSTGSTREPAGTKLFITPFTPNVVMSAIKFAHGAIGDSYNGSSLMLIKEDSGNPIAVKSVEEFIYGKFDELWDHAHERETVIKLDSKLGRSLVENPKSVDTTNQYQ